MLDAVEALRRERARESPPGGGGPAVSAIGLGCMGMSWAYGAADEGESVATIHAALDAGVDAP